MSLRHARDLRERFMAIGVSKNLASQLSSEVSQWVLSSGQEWTVNRLKLLKTAFLRRIAGEAYSLPYVAKRLDSLGAVPKGPFGVLWNNVDASDITTISRALNCMMVYSTFVSEVVTPKQWEKFHTSMTREAPLPEMVKGVVDSLRIPKWMRVDGTFELETIEEFVVRKGYSHPFVSAALDKFIESDTGMDLWEEFPQYKQSFNTLAAATNSRIAWDDMFNYHPVPDSRSTLSPIGTLGNSGTWLQT